MNNELFDFSNLEIETEDNNTFNKNDRGSYKAQDVIISNPEVYTGKEIILNKENNKPIQKNNKSMSFTTDIGAVANAVSVVINSLGNIVTSFNMVSMEREVTKRAKIQAEAFVVKEKELTKRYIVNEKEQTKRLKSKLINDYRKAQLDLIGVVEKLKKEEREFNKNHELNIETLRGLMNSLEMETNNLEQLNQIVIEKFKIGEEIDSSFLAQINEIGRRKIEIMKIIVQIK